MTMEGNLRAFEMKVVNRDDNFKRRISGVKCYLLVIQSG